MRNPLHNLRTVGAKVAWIVTIISGSAVLLVSLSAGLWGYINSKRLMVETITSQTLMVAMNSSAPLAFRDREMASDALSVLEVVDGIRHAALIDVQGRMFAEFSPAAESGATPAGPGTRYPLHPLGHRDVGDGYVLVVPVVDQAGVHGRLQVTYSGARLARHAVALALQSAALSLAAMLLAWLLATRLRPILTAPVVELERAMQHVRDTGEYGARARRVSSDELGRLTDAFNAMLEQIETNRDALVDAQQRAEEASRLKDEFVATLSHELRTPLSPIMAWIQMLRLPRGRAELPDALDVMERNARALIRIIDDLLDMSRIVSGTLRLDVQPVDIDAIIRAAVETLAPAAQGRRLQVALQLAAPRPHLRGDPARLQQVVWNLLSNAIKFSPEGGRVSIATVTSGMRLDIIVADNGTGIDPAFLPFVFERFRQQDGSITRTHGGLGLGLSIVRQLVELHGGTARAESAGTGTGSTFIVSLPIAGAEPEGAGISAPAEEAAPAHPRLDGVAVLVVEDHADMRAVIRSALEDAGAVVREAANTREAMARLAAAPPDVLVSDIGLPDQDGYALLRQIRRGDGTFASVPAIAVTAYAHPAERMRALDAGYQLHLSKPVHPAELVAAVAALAMKPKTR